MQHLGLVSFLIFFIGLLVTVTKLPGGLHLTFSQRVAHRKKVKILYSLLFIVGLSILYLFFKLWLVPTKHLPLAFLLFAAISIFFQVACTFIPEEGGTKTLIHRLLTGISGAALLPLMIILMTSQTINTSLRVITGVSLILMLFLLIVALANQKGFKYALLLQIGYYAIFFCSILLVTYG